MELIVATIIAGSLAVMALVSYARAVRVAHVEEAIKSLQLLYGANRVFRAKNWTYWPTDGAVHTLNDINTALQLSLTAVTFTFQCTGNGVIWNCTADSTPLHGAANPFIIRVTQADLSATNPQCTTNNCP